MNLRVVVADDQAVIRSGFAALLNAHDGIEVVGEASDGRELLDVVDREVPDVALVDVRMPHMDGIEATAQITRRHPTRVLILTTFDLDAYVYESLRAGASGFLLKDVTATTLVNGVRVLGGGAMLLGPEASRRLVANFAAPKGRDTAALRPLSPREREVFDLLAKGRSNAEIAELLFVSVETVKSHVAEVLRKLQLRDRIQAVVYAHEHGLVGL